MFALAAELWTASTEDTDPREPVYRAARVHTRREETETAEVGSPMAAAPGDELVLRLITDEGASTWTLPRAGEVCVGRSRECEVRLEASSLSRRHALLNVGDSLKIKDLGSSNGTKVRGERIAPEVWIEVLPGELVEFGSVLAVVQRFRGEARPLRIYSHAAFEARVEDACEEADAGGFAVVRLHFARPVDAGTLASVMHGRLHHGECIALYAPGDYEILLRGAIGQTFAARAEELREEAAEVLEVEATVGLAAFPEDGVGPEELLAHASAQLHKDAAPQKGGDEPLVLDPRMVKLYELIDRVAKGAINVLVEGETGVGKEKVAESIHKRSPRGDKPFVRLNCAAFSESLLESELFGHEKGAFTGATRARTGLLLSAHQGTVFLDEIGEIPAAMQSKLLRVLEERAVRPVGSEKSRPLDVRFVCATNRNLEEEINAGRFRRDLFFRLAGVTLSVPPLRERNQEIEPLAVRFLRQTWAQLGRSGAPHLTDAAVHALRRYAWPGNIRELRNMMERAALLAAGDRIDVEHLPVEKMDATWVETTPAGPMPKPAGAEVTPAPGGEAGAKGSDDERQRIIDALQACAGNQTRAARMLGISRRTLAYRLDAYNLPRPQKKIDAG